MCGIVGIFHYGEPGRRVDTDLLREMTLLLAHRGPDGEGVWSAPGVGLGHRRLAILDLSHLADQPMIDDSGDHVISFNGQIYNFRELRHDLESLGHRFRSTGDTEVLLKAYVEWGRDVVERISGIFAFAIWDARRRRLFLARDPLGVKPLFFSLGRNCFWFASEIKAILRDPRIDRTLDREALDAFFTFSYTPAPLTGLRHVRQLLPGQAATVSEDGLRTWRYWRMPYGEKPQDLALPAAQRAFEARLDRVTRRQMVSDVGVAAFLSGGLDSAAVVRAMKRADEGPVRAFSVGFDCALFDERPRARATARSLDVELTERLISVDAGALLPKLALHLEEPTADSSALPTYLLCQVAASSFKVAMSGDGADELLAGYDTYAAGRLASRYRRLPAAVRRQVLARLARALPASDRKYGLHQRAVRFTYGAELGPGRDHCAWRIICTEDLKEHLYRPGFRASTAGLDPLGRYAAHIDAVPPTRHPLAGLLNADTEFYLPNDMLVKVDRMSMAHGLEVRVPFLDPEMVRFCANLPEEFKLHRGRVRKHILRESLRGSVPRAVLRAPKSGFNLPLERWMRGSLGAMLIDSVATVRHQLSEFLEVEEIRRMAERHRRRRTDYAHALFTILMFALWLDNMANAWRGDVGRHGPARRER